MMNICVVGLQWGDEGKGKIVDMLSENADVVIRYSGGANAGHTVQRSNKEESFALHLLPSGILREGVDSVIANGVVMDADIVISELEGLKKRGIDAFGRLKISSRAHLVMPYHKKQDILSEAALGKGKIGTTARGIGPCYGDKIARSTAVRVADLLDLPALEPKLKRIIEFKNKFFAGVYGDNELLDSQAIYNDCCRWAQILGPMIIDTTAYLHKAWKAGKRMLFEGAQGSMLDLDHGTFPFVTSSNSSAVGLPAATGVPAKAVDCFLGIVKAYSTRVGSGPFPTEQDNEIGDTIRVKGHEFGTTTGRPRRCGWFDAVCTSFAIQIGGIDEVAMQHLDTLSGLKELKVCTGYKYQGELLDFYPSEASILEQVECVYETLPGFDADLRGIENWDDLPELAKNYIDRVEQVLQCPITMVGVGPQRSQTLRRVSKL